MYTLLLTGGIGAGKSTVCEVFGAHGAHVVDLDVLSHRVLEQPEVKTAIFARFGDDLADDTTGEIVRHKLAERAFADEQSVADLDAITHPAIMCRLSQELEYLAQAPDAPTLCVVEVQVAEAADPRMADEVMTLSCPVSVRRQRAVERGMDPQDFDARDGAQICDEQRAALADTVIDSSIERAGLEAAIDAWYTAREAQGWSRRSAFEPPLQPRPVEQPQGLPSPAIAFVGRHNSGKTTMVVAVIAELVRRGIDVGSVKHHGHRGFEIDVEGKDSWRHRHAGASEVAIASPDQFALIRSLDEDMGVEDILAQMRPHDVAIVEGYRHSSVPTIEVMRAANERDRAAGEAFVASVASGTPLEFNPEGRALLGNDADRVPGKRTVGVASDMPRVLRAAAQSGMRPFYIDDIVGICDFICTDVLKQEKH